ncbi:MAG: transcription termination factor NusA [Candidatus Sumerlaeia bacterium]|nr:transcription termination factor NusA [Candidatus Sumerlaeia bacterium]
MLQNLTNFVRQLSKEKDLEPEVIKEAIEQSLVAASKKNLSHFRNARASLDLATGQLDLLVTKTVVEKVDNPRLEIDLRSARKIRKDVRLGEDIEVVVDPSVFGRIAAQSARQVVMQRLREAERQKIYAEFKEKVGQVVTGIVQRFERRDAVVNIGRAEGILPLNQQPYGARYRIGERLKVLITEIERTSRGPVIRLSRTDPELVLKLFEQEVPEVADGTVKILAVAREAGVRTKVAVTSTNPDVDPVGACVGMKGSRVQMIVREFENEKIDIVPYSNNPATFITAALNPAKIVSVKVRPETGEADVLVARGNLSLAIGKRGQNARLAAKLTGWKINIKGEEETELEAAAAEIRQRYLTDFLQQITDLTDFQRDIILKSSYNSVEKLATADAASLMNLLQSSEELASQLISDAQEYLDALAEMQQAETEKEAAAAAAAGSPVGGESSSAEKDSERAAESPAEP